MTNNDVIRVLASFPFEEVRDYMRANDWQWAGIVGIPSVSDLRKTAADILTMALNSPLPSTECGTGGFWANKFSWGNGTQGMSLSFQPWRSEVATHGGAA